MLCQESPRKQIQKEAQRKVNHWVMVCLIIRFGTREKEPGSEKVTIQGRASRSMFFLESEECLDGDSLTPWWDLRESRTGKGGGQDSFPTLGEAICLWISV